MFVDIDWCEGRKQEHLDFTLCSYGKCPVTIGDNISDEAVTPRSKFLETILLNKANQIIANPMLATPPKQIKRKTFMWKNVILPADANKADSTFFHSLQETKLDGGSNIRRFFDGMSPEGYMILIVMNNSEKKWCERGYCSSNNKNEVGSCEPSWNLIVEPGITQVVCFKASNKTNIGTQSEGSSTYHGFVEI
jgi:hypothetical protein